MNPFLIYFWVSTLSLCIAPFVFNPHQFSFSDFIIDYRYVRLWSCYQRQLTFMQRVPTLDEPR
jgi:hypothetical protein